MENDLQKINERLDFLEFRQGLLFENTNVSRYIFEDRITRNQYEDIMDIMEEFRSKIDNKEEVHHATFEEKIYKAINSFGDYHFCEGIARAFMEDGRWTEVFKELYGNMDKYKILFDK